MTEHELRRAVTSKVIAHIQRERHNPPWRPTGMLNGGIEVVLKARARLKRLEARRQREATRKEGR